MMIPEPSNSASEGSSLPPRHRPALENLAKDTTELDLWDFDELTDAAGTGNPDFRAMPTVMGPGFRVSQSAPVSPPGELAVPKLESIRRNISKGTTRLDADKLPEHPATDADFDDLDHDDVLELLATSDQAVKPSAQTDPNDLIAVPPHPAEAGDGPTPATVVNPTEPAEPARPTMVPRESWHLNLSVWEKSGLIVLALLLLGGAGMILSFAAHWLPTQSLRQREVHFPVHGKHITVVGAETYWREPLVDGPSRDVFRRGAELLPVLELTVKDAPAVLRVLFRNDEGKAVGDPITRRLLSDGQVSIPATAGFEDLGMHAAYRIGESKPWRVEVLEADPGSDKNFTRVFEIDITGDRR